MELLCGIFLSEGAGGNLNSTLENMLGVQRHRDDSKSVTCIGDYFAFGTANRHDSVYYPSSDNDPLSVSGNYKCGIYAFVDGVVLDVPAQR